MAKYPPSQVAVVAPRYCAPCAVDMSVVRKVMTMSRGSFDVADLSGNILFKVRGSVLSLRDRRVLFDAAGNPLLTLQRKLVSMHRRWKAYRAESCDPRDLLFSVKRSSLVQLMGMRLHVYLANNTGEECCDFRVEGSWSRNNCVIYAGYSNSVVTKVGDLLYRRTCALLISYLGLILPPKMQMHEKHSVQSFLLGKDRFMVTVYPGVDAAFIVAIIIILDSMDKEDGGSDREV
ncbi:hypothetical protein MLD38_021520 [Melastoma candidum]|uniref:Uncharacterized protein n=1 Tax=Melastoma candidum TaxID=119954 RepID=A0ACB9QPG8_9MYRT|nr:hypothetical protein MLD38_021520 [Melastoma candidum]